MTSYLLNGDVSKAPLLVAPAYARSSELVRYLKFRLYDAGFVVVRDESRLLNEELAEKLCVALDQSAVYAPLGSDVASSSKLSEGPAVHQMVGMAHIFIVAHRDCHNQLRQFVAGLQGGEESAAYHELMAGAVAPGSPQQCSPTWINKTSIGATRAVALLFPRMLAATVPTATESREYVQANVKNALLPVLTELVKTKPVDPLRWLAQRLMNSEVEIPSVATTD